MAYDVSPFGTQRPADADLASPFGDRRKHDVHDPDATDEQRDRRNHPHKQHEHRTRRASLFEQLQRHDHRDVFHLIVVHQSRLHQLSRLLDLRNISAPESDLVELDDLPFTRPGSHGHDRIADALLQRLDRNVDVVGEILSRHRSTDRCSGTLGLEHADNEIEILVLWHVDPLPNGIFVGEQPFGNFSRQHAVAVA